MFGAQHSLTFLTLFRRRNLQSCIAGGTVEIAGPCDSSGGKTIRCVTALSACWSYGRAAQAELLLICWRRLSLLLTILYPNCGGHPVNIIWRLPAFPEDSRVCRED